MYKTVVFDLDGTLLNTLEDIADAVNETLAEFGLPTHSLDTIRPMLGDGTDALIHRALSGHVLAPLDMKAFKEKYLLRYDRYQKNKTRPYPDIVEVLGMLKRRHIHLFVYSNKPDFLAQEVVRHYFGEGTFAGILGQKPGAKPKPDPSGLLKMLAEYQIPLAEAVFVGDSNVDIQTAKNAGLKSIGVTWGFRSYQELVLAGADDIVSDAEDIYNICLDYRKVCL
jgi:phosphoglycolate phosphatase